MRTILYLIAAIFVVMWIVGFIFRYIVSPLVHLLLVAALVMIALRFIGSKVNRKVE
jgi:cell division protein FtsW (lipid II flippase)